MSDVTILTLNETWYCPVRCGYCHVGPRFDLGAKTVLTDRMVEDASRQAADCGISHCRFSGGEPLSTGESLLRHARTVAEITGAKPYVLTSGGLIDDEWKERAQGVFSAIHVSVENPFRPLQTRIDPWSLLDCIRADSSPQLPLALGVTLLHPDQFEQADVVFRTLYERSGRGSLPQLGCPTLYSWVNPTERQLQGLTKATARIFSEHGPVPFYFSDVVGSIAYVSPRRTRYVVNLTPDGRFMPGETLEESLRRLREIKEAAQQERQSKCSRCDWAQVCNPFVEGIDVPHEELCRLRRAVFEGIADGLGQFDLREDA